MCVCVWCVIRSAQRAVLSEMSRTPLRPVKVFNSSEAMIATATPLDVVMKAAAVSKIKGDV